MNKGDNVPFRSATVAVVIVAYRSAEHLGACLDGLRDDSAISSIVVVDNSLDADTEALVSLRSRQDTRITLLTPDANKGFAGGCNIGAAATNESDFLLFLNPDARLTRGMGELVTALASHEAIIASARLVSNSPWESINARPLPSVRRELQKAVVGSRAYSLRHSLPPASRVGQVDGALLVISREDFLRLEGFDERFELYYEDVDLCARAAQHGGCLFVNATWGEHVGGASFDTASAAAFTALRISRVRYLVKHVDGRLRGLAAALCVALAEWAVRSLTRRPESQSTRNKSLVLQLRELVRPLSVSVLEQK